MIVEGVHDRLLLLRNSRIACPRITLRTPKSYGISRAKPLASYFDTYRDGDAKSWLLKIVRRTCYSWLERNRPANVVSLEAEAEPGDAVVTASSNAEALLESRSRVVASRPADRGAPGAATRDDHP